MSKTFIDKACAVVPEFENRISRFDKKLRIAQYAEHSIYDYKLKNIYEEVNAGFVNHHIPFLDWKNIRIPYLFPITIFLVNHYATKT